MSASEGQKRRMSGRSLVAALAAIFVMTAFVCGCGQHASTGQKTSVEGGTEITMWLIGSEDQALTIRGIAKEFYKETKIRVKCDAISWGDAHSKYLTSIAGGVAPDIGTMGLTWGAEFGSLGAMVDLAAIYPAEINTIREQVFPGLWNSIVYNNKIFGIPFDMTEYVMYYRSDIIPDPPKTWGELTALLADLNKSGKGMLFDWGSLSWIGFSPFLWQAGGAFYNADATASALDAPEAIAALVFFSDLYTKYNVPKTKIPIEQGMRTGDFPLAISGNWQIDALRLLAPEIAGKWKIATLPKGPNGTKTGFIGGRMVGIFDQSKHKEEAWLFIKFLFRPEIQSILYEAALTKQDTYLPPSRRGWEILSMPKEFKDTLVEQANDSNGPPPVLNWDSSAKYVDEAIQKVILQGADPKTELEAAKRYLDGALKI